jgi:hypothetical protein
MIAILIAFGSLACGAAFTLAWVFRRDVRAWLEQPKYRFQDELRRYDGRTIAEDANQ